MSWQTVKTARTHVRLSPCRSLPGKLIPQICNHFLATSDAAHVDLDRIPLEGCTVDDVYTRDRQSVLKFAGRAPVLVVALDGCIVVRKAPTRTTLRACSVEASTKVGPLEEKDSRRRRKTSTYL